MADKRFEIIENQSGFVQEYSVLVDHETGVNYLILNSVNGCSITPLLDRNGKVIVTE